MSPLDRHDKIALHFSGGKDSLACVHLLRDELHRITVYHLDTGDQLPELQESVAAVEAMAPHFVRIQGDVPGWIARNGIPTDLVPYASHPIGRMLGQERVPLVPRYDCCFSNIMQPLGERTSADGCTLIIRGTKRADMPHLPWASGEIDAPSGIELYLPLQDWTDEDVLGFLRSQGIPLSRFYADGLHSASDCARCSAWWDEGRGAYLRKHHPEIWADYRARLGLILNEIIPPMGWLRTELGHGQ